MAMSSGSTPQSSLQQEPRQALALPSLWTQSGASFRSSLRTARCVCSHSSPRLWPLQLECCNMLHTAQVLTPTLGVTFATDRIARSLHAFPGDGALIQALDSRSGAAKAGLMATRRGLSGIVAGDVITSVSGKRIKYPQDVEAALDEAQVGETVVVKFRRGIEMVLSFCCVVLPPFFLCPVISCPVSALL
jgi:hypothetical protein